MTILNMMITTAIAMTMTPINNHYWHQQPRWKHQTPMSKEGKVETNNCNQGQNGATPAWTWTRSWGRQVWAATGPSVGTQNANRSALGSSSVQPSNPLTMFAAWRHLECLHANCSNPKFPCSFSAAFSTSRKWSEQEKRKAIVDVYDSKLFSKQHTLFYTTGAKTKIINSQQQLQLQKVHNGKIKWIQIILIMQTCMHKKIRNWKSTNIFSMLKVAQIFSAKINR